MLRVGFQLAASAPKRAAHGRITQHSAPFALRCKTYFVLSCSPVNYRDKLGKSRAKVKTVKFEALLTTALRRLKLQKASLV